ncbi:hypothetical protein C4K68_15580 [Pokkaliibacter plantistimulans]|uniref:Zinc finger DksA/TraR C4-type domain-containing protein n=2 Tax=Pseudomonadota TaxID=1224 RepID=A0A2S5KNE9_9PROT|nr:hypothetical protein C4K68_15580 [Pokkaliibacter plantistimulans]
MGKTKMAGLTTSHILDLQRSLLDRYRLLIRQLTGLESDLEGYVSSKAGFQLASVKDCMSELRQVQEALELIEEGEYGVCQCCGADIEPERLLSQPLTKYCNQCACYDKKK